MQIALEADDNGESPLRSRIARLSSYRSSRSVAIDIPAPAQISERTYCGYSEELLWRSGIAQLREAAARLYRGCLISTWKCMLS